MVITYMQQISQSNYQINQTLNQTTQAVNKLEAQQPQENQSPTAPQQQPQTEQ
jgi:hypothetical protein